MPKERNWNRNGKDDNSGFERAELPPWHVKRLAELKKFFKKALSKKREVTQGGMPNINIQLFQDEISALQKKYSGQELRDKIAELLKEDIN